MTLPKTKAHAIGEQAGFRYAWDWFELHSKQRIYTINFYIVIVAALFAASATVIKESNYALGLVFGFLISLSSLLFFGMDRRARILVIISEEALLIEEQRLCDEVQNPALALVEKSRHSGLRGWTYGRIFYAMFGSFAAIGMMMAGYCAAKI